MSLEFFLEDEELRHDLLRTCFVPAFSIACHRQLRCLASCVHFLVICGQLNCAWFIPGALLWKFLQHRCVAYFMNYKPDCDYSSSTCEKKKITLQYHYQPPIWCKHKNNNSAFISEPPYCEAACLYVLLNSTLQSKKKKRGGGVVVGLFFIHEEHETLSHCRSSLKQP